MALLQRADIYYRPSPHSLIGCRRTGLRCARMNLLKLYNAVVAAECGWLNGGRGRLMHGVRRIFLAEEWKEQSIGVHDDRCPRETQQRDGKEFYRVRLVN